MRVGILSDIFIPESKAIAIRMYHLALAFHNESCQVTIHTSTKGTKNDLFSIITNYFSAPSSDKGVISRLISECLLGTELFLRVLTSKHQLIIISTPPFIASIMVVLAARIKKIPYILDVRDEYPEVYFTANLINRNSFSGKLLKWFERSAYTNALIVTSVTEGICNRIVQKAGKEISYLLRNGFDETIFKPSDNKPDQFTIIFHGNIGKFQRPDLLIELARLAYRRKLPFLFKVIGWGNNDKVLKENLVPNLEYLGMIDYSQIPLIIASAHVGISFRTPDIISVNSFPVKLYEYIGVGLPVIISPISEAGNFVEHNNLGFQFSGESVEEILDSLIVLYSNKEMLNSLSENVIKIRPQFSRQYSCKSFAKRVLNQLL